MCQCDLSLIVLKTISINLVLHHQMLPNCNLTVNKRCHVSFVHHNFRGILRVWIEDRCADQVLLWRKHSSNSFPTYTMSLYTFFVFVFSPAFLTKVKDTNLRKFGKSLCKIWEELGRKVIIIKQIIVDCYIRW